MATPVKSILDGRRLAYSEVAQLGYEAGWRRENLAIMVAVVDWESARYERAQLIYDDGSADQGMMQISSRHRGSYSQSEWDAFVWNAASNIGLGRSLWLSRRKHVNTAEYAWRGWYAYGGGNYKRSWQVAKHWAAQVDATYFPLQSFRWWGARWIKGDGAIFSVEWSKHGLSLKALERWKVRYPKQAALLWSSGVQEAKELPLRDEDGSTFQTEAYILMDGEEPEFYNIS